MKSVLFKTFLFLIILNSISCSKVEFIDPNDAELNNTQFRSGINYLSNQFFPFQDVDSQNFFPNSVHSELNDFAVDVYKELEKQNGIDPFVDDVVSRIGVPLWNNLLASNATQNYERYLLIPFDNEGDEVSGLIYCVETEKGKYKFALIEKSLLVEFIQSNSTAWNNIASYLVVSCHFFDQLVFGISNDVLLQFMSNLNIDGGSSNRDDCYSYYDCILPVWEGSQYANYDFATGGVTNTSMFLGNFLLNQNIVWLEIFYGGLECMEIEVCPSGEPIIFFQNDWTPGYTPTNNSGGISTNETPSGVNDGLNLTLEEWDEFDMQLFLFARNFDIPFTIEELRNWVSYGCMNPNDRLDMDCAWESFLSNFNHQDIDPFLAVLGIGIEDLLSMEFNISDCLNSNDFEACASESILEKRFDVDIVDTYIIEEVLMGVDSDGILHVDIEPISMQNSTRLEIFNQLLNVIKATRMLFCEIQIYEPIDLQDYYYDMRTQFWTTTWSGHDDVTLDLPLILSRYIIDTTPEKENPVGTRFVYLWRWKGTNIPGIAISIPGTATSALEEFVLYDCE